MTTPLFTGSDWNFDLIHRVQQACEEIAVEELKLDFYPNQIEIVSSEQMLDAYASIGMPIMYNHWSYGKTFLQNYHNYRKGLQGLAYELVINSNPCISYCMEDNTALMQTLVIAHACYGHNSFFKGNYLFREWTDADSIIDYLVFARNYIAACEDKYGLDEVESILDAAHNLMNVGVDRYRKPARLNPSQEKMRQTEREAYLEKQINDLWRTLPPRPENTVATAPEIEKRRQDLRVPEENFLYFLEKKSPILKTWQREILRIVRKIAQYFYPQRQTQVMNEGWASHTHYFIMTRLHEKGLITDGAYLEFIHSHTGVLHQRLWSKHRSYEFNPYALGFAMFEDIKRISMTPTQEDQDFFPDFAGNGDWLGTITYAMKNFRDESFISQYLSPKVMRDFQMFSVHDDSDEKHYTVTDIHNEHGYKNIRKKLSHRYNISNLDPDMQIWDADMLGNRELVIKYFCHNGVPLADNSVKVLKSITRLWGYSVRVIEVNNETQQEKDIFRVNP